MTCRARQLGDVPIPPLGSSARLPRGVSANCAGRRRVPGVIRNAKRFAKVGVRGAESLQTPPYTSPGEFLARFPLLSFRSALGAQGIRSVFRANPCEPVTATCAVPQANVD